ncbi:MAG: hypothetical protein PHY26_04475, partial [Bacilli bacterium]|nr:hypothetical protein [Bacilli bacterium]
LDTIQPRERITEDMIGYAEIPPGMIIGNVISNANLIEGRYANYNTVIPAGSLFYRDSIVAAEELPDSAFLDIPEGNTPFNFPVDIESTYGNSIFPGNYINIYFKALDETGKIIVGKLAENIKVLSVKDRTGKHVFENTEDERVPSTIIFAVPEEIHLLLRKAYYLGYVANINAELIPVPNTEAYYTEPGAVTITNQYLQSFINVNTGYVPIDELPDVGEEPEYEEENEGDGVD